MLKFLNQKSTKIFEIVVSKIDQNGYKKFESDSNCFMALVVERIGKDDLLGTSWELYSFAHYYEQNGDLMRDPEMCFAYDAVSKRVFPYYFRMDGSIPVEQESVSFENGGYTPHTQRDHALFANTWMKNIKYQQNL